MLVMFLFGWKLKMQMSPKLPIGLPFHVDPMASAASSITRSLCSAASAYNASMSHGRPPKCVGMIALVRGPIRAAVAARSRLRVPGSTSTNTGVAPTLTIMLGAAKNVMDGVITSSPGPMPATCSAISSAAVADDTTRTGRPPTVAASAASNAFTLGPLVIQPERSTSATSATVASSSVGRENGRCGSALIGSARP